MFCVGYGVTIGVILRSTEKDKLSLIITKLFDCFLTKQFISPHHIQGIQPKIFWDSSPVLPTSKAPCLFNCGVSLDLMTSNYLVLSCKWTKKYFVSHHWWYEMEKNVQLLIDLENIIQNAPLIHFPGWLDVVEQFLK